MVFWSIESFLAWGLDSGWNVEIKLWDKQKRIWIDGLQSFKYFGSQQKQQQNNQKDSERDIEAIT